LGLKLKALVGTTVAAESMLMDLKNRRLLVFIMVVLSV
jgi:hypothetical protein